jgi:hypothetical protein
MARTDQWHDERTEVIHTPQTDHDRTYRPDGSDPDHETHAYDQDPDGYVDPDRTQVVSGVATPDRDEPVHHDPVEQPTAFGAATVGGAVAASAMAGPERLHEQRDPRADDTVRTGDGPVPDETAIGRTDHDEFATRSDDDTTVLPSDERTTVLTGEDDTATLTGEEQTATLADEDDTSTLPDGDQTATLPTDMPADASAVPAAPAFFAADEADAFRSRWRDVQLRFVDDPHAAAGEAQGLVTEAVEALTAALTAQRDELGGWTNAGPEDTEQLRMVVRRYRDLLDRVLAI